MRTLKEKTQGLIGADPVYPVSFSTRWGIHTFGVPSSVDIVILNKDNRVAVLHNGLPPNRFFFWNPKYETVLELPPGTIKEKNISVGSIIRFLL